jgi:hypothetical protein
MGLCLAAGHKGREGLEDDPEMREGGLGSRPLSGLYRTPSFNLSKYNFFKKIKNKNHTNQNNTNQIFYSTQE